VYLLIVGADGYCHSVTFSDTDTLGKTSLNEGSVRGRGLYLINAQQTQQTSMSPVGVEPAIPASERLQNYALHHADTVSVLAPG